MIPAVEEPGEHTSSRQRVDPPPFTDVSTRVPANEHPTIWAYVGEGRYLQAAFCRSTARLYAAQFGTTTLKSLSNIAAKCKQLSLLEWCRDMGCTWDESLYVSGAVGGSTAVLDLLFQKGCPLPPQPDPAEAAILDLINPDRCPLTPRYALEEACAVAAAGDHVEALWWLSNKGLWWENACAVAARAGKLKALSWLLAQKTLRGGQVEEDWLTQLCTSACEGGQVEVLDWLKQRNCPWNVEKCVALAIKQGRLEILKYLHSRESLPLDGTAATEALLSDHIDVLEYLHELGCCLLPNPERLPMVSRMILRQWKEILAEEGGREVVLKERQCVCAAKFGSLAALRWLRSEGCPWDSDTLRVARLFSKESRRHEELAAWALANGCPEPRTS